VRAARRHHQPAQAGFARSLPRLQPPGVRPATASPRRRASPGRCRGFSRRASRSGN